MAVKCKQLSTSDRKAVYYNCLSFCEDGVPVRGCFATVAGLFSVDPMTVARLWKSMSKKLESDGDINQDDDQQQWLVDKTKGLPDEFFASGATNRRKGKCVHDREDLKARIKAIPSNKRRKLRHLSAQLNIPLSTVHTLMKQFKVIKRNTNSVKPILTTGNKHLRVMHALDHINMATRNSRSGMKYHDMYNEIHVDEKWFFICRDGETYVIVSDEEEPPKRHVSHKGHITKVMFLCAQARPRRLSNNTWWDGKVGIWPIGYYRAAEKTSKNRPAGTRLFEPESIDMDKCRSMMQSLVVPATLNEFPECEFNRYEYIVIQQDGAPSHIKPSDFEWNQYLEDMGLQDKIRLVTQPANSPDANINDLGFFAALQSMYCCTTPTNAIQLIEMVEQTYQEYPMNKINRIWITLQTVFNGTLEYYGGNDYPMVHMGKEKLEREGRLPSVLQVHEMAKCFLND